MFARILELTPPGLNATQSTLTSATAATPKFLCSDTTKPALACCHYVVWKVCFDWLYSFERTDGDNCWRWIAPRCFAVGVHKWDHSHVVAIDWFGRWSYDFEYPIRGIRLGRFVRALVVHGLTDGNESLALFEGLFGDLTGSIRWNVRPLLF